jgi:hypothetical protein
VIRGWGIMGSFNIRVSKIIKYHRTIRG